MLTLHEFAVRNLFYRVKDDAGNPIYWRTVAVTDGGGGEGYLMVWPDGDHHHTYKHPVTYSGFEPWPWDDES